jgi:hypothetical protein
MKIPADSMQAAHDGLATMSDKEKKEQAIKSYQTNKINGRGLGGK